MKIRPAKESDKSWVEPIFREHDFVLGKGFFGTIWYRYWTGGSENEFWDVIPCMAFVHYKRRKDGVNVIYEIAVGSEFKRKGLGKMLLDHVGYPMELKTDVQHRESNAFYKGCGFYPAGEKRSRDGLKRMRIWVKS